ncbi:hypothetical protein LguiB_027372 [Lonicera macranthoides]
MALISVYLLEDSTYTTKFFENYRELKNTTELPFTPHLISPSAPLLPFVALEIRQASTADSFSVSSSTAADTPPPPIHLPFLPLPLPVIVPSRSCGVSGGGVRPSFLEEKTLTTRAPSNLEKRTSESSDGGAIPRGSEDSSVLTSFESHKAYAIWNNPVARKPLKCIHRSQKLKEWDITKECEGHRKIFRSTHGWTGVCFSRPFLLEMDNPKLPD